MKAELKTRPSARSVAKFMKGITDERRRADCQRILEVMEQVTGAEPRMWSRSVVGFGDYHYKYASGREGDTFLVGFSARKQNLSLYFASYVEKYPELLKKLGKHKTGKGCLYIKSLDDIHLPMLRKLIQESVKRVRESQA